MKKTIGFFTTVLIAFTLMIGGIPDADAKRFGSSRSFGGKSSFGSPFKKSTTAKPTRSPSQKKAYNQNQSARQGMNRRGGLMGMLGGLALGGMLGALFFGGAFENFNIMDILVFGAIAYLLFKLFSSKASRRQPVYSRESYDSPASRQKTESIFSNSSDNHSATFETDMLFDKNNQSAYKEKNNWGDLGFEEVIVPKDFDEADFLAGATGAFKDLQKAWDIHDLAKIRALTTDQVFSEIQSQLQDSTEKNQTDVLKISAELLSIKELGTVWEAVVLFDALIKEESNAEAEAVNEVWHFIKNRNSVQPKWLLNGIQQLDD